MIQKLPAEVIDQIAAGEVVDRPAHLVKELVENSLDAGATEIEVEFDQGGRRVRVSDNGRGIPSQELPLALARHATSKINKADDLWSLNSFGFRGEALASIGAVCKLSLSSKVSEASHRYRVSCDFGVVGEIEVVGGTEGTRVEISDLFANVPARLKFLKSESAETAQIKITLKALALNHPQVQMRILNKGQLIYFWPSVSDALTRAEQVLEYQPLYCGEGECDFYKAKVYVGAPHQVAKSSRQIWLFVQERWVQDRSLQAAVMDAYRGLLMHGEYPYAVIHLKVAPEDVDVNVHPTKTQVKFRNSSSAFRAVHRGVRGVLEKAPWLAEILPVKAIPEQRLSFSIQVAQEEMVQNFSGPEFARIQYAQPSLPTIAQMKESAENRSDLGVVSTDLKGGDWSQLQVLGQAANTYIITQSDKGLVIIDQHAAHERVAYERLLDQWKHGPTEVQNLLLPLVVNLPLEQVEMICGLKDELVQMGLEFELSGPENLMLTTVPCDMKEAAVVKAFEFLGKELSEKSGSFAIEKSRNALAATLACHSVVRAGQALSREQMHSLLVQMDEFPLSSFCPHGRPVFVEFPFQKLEKDFGRIV